MPVQLLQKFLMAKERVRWPAGLKEVQQPWLRLCSHGNTLTRKSASKKVKPGTARAEPGLVVLREKIEKCQALNELPQPQVDLTLGLLNLKPEPSMLST